MKLKTMAAKFLRSFHVKFWPGGHIHVGAFTIFAVYNPHRNNWMVTNRPYPWARFGLPHDRMWAINFRGLMPVKGKKSNAGKEREVWN